MADKIDKEELVGQFLCGWVSPLGVELVAVSLKKRQALERYMRTFLRALTIPELEFELKYAEDNDKLSADVEYRLLRASRGYDAYVKQYPVKKETEIFPCLADYQQVHLNRAEAL